VKLRLRSACLVVAAMTSLAALTMVGGGVAAAATRADSHGFARPWFGHPVERLDSDAGLISDVH
jgi:hypothetical protein